MSLENSHKEGGTLSWFLLKFIISYHFAYYTAMIITVLH
jgi:hypothetical protein